MLVRIKICDDMITQEEKHKHILKGISNSVNVQSKKVNWEYVQTLTEST